MIQFIHEPVTLCPCFRFRWILYRIVFLLGLLKRTKLCQRSVKIDLPLFWRAVGLFSLGTNGTERRAAKPWNSEDAPVQIHVRFLWTDGLPRNINQTYLTLCDAETFLGFFWVFGSVLSLLSGTFAWIVNDVWGTEINNQSLLYEWADETEVIRRNKRQKITWLERFRYSESDGGPSLPRDNKSCFGKYPSWHEKRQSHKYKKKRWNELKRSKLWD